MNIDNRSLKTNENSRNMSTIGNWTVKINKIDSTNFCCFKFLQQEVKQKKFFGLLKICFGIEPTERLCRLSLRIKTNVCDIVISYLCHEK